MAEGLGASEHLAPGAVLGEIYRIQDILGSGGYGTVYRALHLHLNAEVALKELVPEHITSYPERTEAIELFRREGQILFQLRHAGQPAFPQVYNLFEEATPSGGKRYYLALEYIKGTDILTATERLTPTVRADWPAYTIILEWAIQLCAALTFLHSQLPPLIYRDLKPENVLVQGTGQIKLIDFGTVRRYVPGKQRDTIPLGTPCYASPENYGHGGQTSPLSDIYSLGALLYHLFTGVKPPDALARLVAVKTGKPDLLLWPRQIRPTLPPALADLLVKALALDPYRRFQSTVALNKALTAILDAPAGAASASTVATEGIECKYCRTINATAGRCKKCGRAVAIPVAPPPSTALVRPAIVRNTFSGSHRHLASRLASFLLVVVLLGSLTTIGWTALPFLQGVFTHPRPASPSPTPSPVRTFTAPLPLRFTQLPDARDLDWEPNSTTLGIAHAPGIFLLQSTGSGNQPLNAQPFNALADTSGIFATPTGIAFAPQGNLLAINLYSKIERELLLWNSSTAKVSARLYHSQSALVNSFSFAPDGNHLVAITSDSTLYLWDTSPATLAIPPPTPTTSPKQASPSSQHHTSVPTATPIVAEELFIDRPAVQTIPNVVAKSIPAFSPDGKLLAIAQPGGVVFYSFNSFPATLQPGSPLPLTGRGPRTNLILLSFSPDSKTLASYSGTRDDASLVLWDVPRGSQESTKSLDPGSGVPLAMTFAHHHPLLFTASDFGVQIWNIASGQHFLLSTKTPVSSLEVAPDDSKVAALSRGTISIWPLATLV